MSDIPVLVQDDPWLQPFQAEIEQRIKRFDYARSLIEENWGSFSNFASLHEKLGVHFKARTDEWVFAEWAPEAQSISVVGEFNNWNGEDHQLLKTKDGFWQISIPHNEIKEGSWYKFRIVGADGQTLDRLPSCAQRVEQHSETHDFGAIIPNRNEAYEWKFKAPQKAPETPLIYECHIGIAGDEGRVHQYREFADNLIPRIVELGYNTIQLMAIAEHPYYGSFGYHVSSYFAASSRFGAINDLKYLIDKAHQAGLYVLLDIVHSHSVKNIAEGLNNFDGSGGQFFHQGERGEHPDWDSKCFDYGREEVQRFLLSNVRYWIEEFQFDGFRFDGVTSMLYWNRGREAFSDYNAYFGENTDTDAILYLQLATSLIKTLKPGALIIAEDMSGMPGLCRPVEEGGVGFTHRLSMGLPDYWIKLLKHSRDEEWNLEEIWGTLSNRRANEPSIAYAESHDQALVGDKSLAFRLMDQEMYWNMSKDAQSPVIERGIALHKMIRLITFACGGEGYLTFMGNEFGHPEWLDFPRKGNNWSYHYCRRQYSLADNEELRYSQLQRFEAVMLALSHENDFMSSDPAKCVRMDNLGRVFAAQRGDYLFVFNFSIDQSYEGSEVYLNEAGTYSLILDSDASEFGGFSRIDSSVTYHTVEDPPRLKLYLPSRSALVLKRA